MLPEPLDLLVAALREQEMFSVPRVGTFVRERQPARFDAATGTLVPPSMQLRLEQGERHLRPFYDYLSRRYGLNRADAESAVQQLGETILAEVRDKGQLVLPDGSVLRPHDGRLVLVQATSDPTQVNYGLPTLKLGAEGPVAVPPPAGETPVAPPARPVSTEKPAEAPANIPPREKPASIAPRPGRETPPAAPAAPAPPAASSSETPEPRPATIPKREKPAAVPPRPGKTEAPAGKPAAAAGKPAANAGKASQSGVPKSAAFSGGAAQVKTAKQRMAELEAEEEAERKRQEEANRKVSKQHQRHLDSARLVNYLGLTVIFMALILIVAVVMNLERIKRQLKVRHPFEVDTTATNRKPPVAPDSTRPAVKVPADTVMIPPPHPPKREGYWHVIVAKVDSEAEGQAKVEGWKKKGFHDAQVFQWPDGNWRISLMQAENQKQAKEFLVQAKGLGGPADAYIKEFKKP